MPGYDFTKEEWETCLKVLNILKDDPFNNPDNQLFSGLITKLSKAAKKAKKADAREERRADDIAVLKSSVIAQNALDNTTLYSDQARPEQPFKKLSRPRNCYACNSPYTDVHFFYARMCPICAQRDYNHRFKTADLTGRTAILTGGRVKVGFAGGEIPKVAFNWMLLKELDVRGIHWEALIPKNPKGHMTNMMELMQMYNEGKIKPRVSGAHKLENFADAMTELSERKVMGKVVLTM